jgi:tetratricopeptide (TPR) repeat protein
MQQVDDAQQHGDFAFAKKLLAIIRERMKAEAPNRPEDPYIVQRLALLTYKSELPTVAGALLEARDILAALDPATSNDTETLGLWGSVHKRLWTVTKDMGQLGEAIRAYQRGFYLRNDYYNGINLAYLLNCRAAEGADSAEAIADFVQARRVRKEVLAICEQWLENNPMPEAHSAGPEAEEQARTSRYWVLATAGEACLGIGEETKGQEQLAAAYAAAPAPWMTSSTQEQVANLKLLLDRSPLRYIRADAPQS